MTVLDARARSRGAGSSRGTRASIALVRARLNDGDIGGARGALDPLLATQGANPELPLLEAMLLEAEGRTEEAFSGLCRIVASTAVSVETVALSNVRIARLATRLGRVEAAEAAAMAILALDPEHIDGLRALAFAQRRRDDANLRLPTIRRLADAPAAEEADLWSAIEAFADFGHWDEVSALIERHEFELDPWRMTPWRLRALIGLGWRRRALERLCKAYAEEYVRAHVAVELLVQWGALSLAAMFIDRCLSSDPFQMTARATITQIATRTCATVNLQEAPCQFADAVQALDIFSPGIELIELEVARALSALMSGAGQLLASDDATGATKMLVAATRLAPAERAISESLAEASHRANLTERHVDTLVRIWLAYRDAPSLLEAGRSVLEISSWAEVARVMVIFVEEASWLGPGADAIAERFRERACSKIEDCLRDGDIVAGLQLVVDLSRWWSVAEWPGGQVSRLLRSAKRRLRSRRAGSAALIAAIGPLYLELAPQDAEVCRMMAQLRVHQRNLDDAREFLVRLVEINPHASGDWVALAMVQNALREPEARDVSIARALLIAPDVALPSELAEAREVMRLV